MRLLRAFFVAFLTELSLRSCVLCGRLLDQAAHVPEMEGQRGMTLIFLCVPLGMLRV